MVMARSLPSATKRPARSRCSPQVILGAVVVGALAGQCTSIVAKPRPDAPRGFFAPRRQRYTNSCSKRPVEKDRIPANTNIGVAAVGNRCPGGPFSPSWTKPVGLCMGVDSGADMGFDLASELGARMGSFVDGES